MKFTELQHITKEGPVLISTCHKEDSTGFAIESADEGKEFIGILVAKPVDQGESAIGSGGVDEPTGRFIDDQKSGLFQDNRGIHERTLVQREVGIEV